MKNSLNRIPYVNLGAQWQDERDELLPILDTVLATGHYVGGDEVDKFEKNIAQTNNQLNNEIQTIFLMTPPELSHISSTIIRDIIKNGGDVSKFIPKEINI